MRSATFHGPAATGCAVGTLSPRRAACRSVWGGGGAFLRRRRTRCAVGCVPAEPSCAACLVCERSPLSRRRFACGLRSPARPRLLNTTCVGWLPPQSRSWSNAPPPAAIPATQGDFFIRKVAARAAPARRCPRNSSLGHATRLRLLPLQTPPGPRRHTPRGCAANSWDTRRCLPRRAARPG